MLFASGSGSCFQFCRYNTLGKSGALRTAPITHVAGQSSGAFGGKLIEPINELGIAATLLNEAVQPVATVALALVATHPQ